MTEFKREPRYIVLKLKDIEAYLSQVEKDALMVMGAVIHKGRVADGKPAFNAVVVEQDWPEFDPAWAAIEARIEREGVIVMDERERCIKRLLELVPMTDPDLTTDYLREELAK